MRLIQVKIIAHCAISFQNFENSIQYILSRQLAEYRNFETTSLEADFSTDFVVFRPPAWKLAVVGETTSPEAGGSGEL
ncbi:MAG: hypothetical protein WBM43_02510 [Flavobacteriaceae bacterium]